MMRLEFFNSTAARLLRSWDVNDIGRVLALDNENGRSYRVAGAGPGAGTMIPESERYGLMSFKLAVARLTDTSGDPGAIAAIGGLMAADSAPLLRADANEDLEAVWAASNVLPLIWKEDVPEDFDGTRDATILVRAASGGTSNACSSSILQSWDEATQVTDAVTGAAATAVANYTGTIAAADMPDAPKTLTLQYVPGTHGTDTHILKRLALRYLRK